MLYKYLNIKEELFMSTEGTQAVLKTLCIIIIILGFVGGILVGRALRTPEVTVDYDSFYFDEVNDIVELKWSNTSTTGMLATWFLSAILSVFAYALSVCLEALSVIHRDLYRLNAPQNKNEPLPKLFKDTE